MSNLIRPVDEQCTGKKGYGSKAIAKRVLRRAPKMDDRWIRSELDVYRCPHCRLFHIGHKAGKNRAQSDA
jgi:hypothetical protein